MQRQRQGSRKARLSLVRATAFHTFMQFTISTMSPSKMTRVQLICQRYHIIPSSHYQFQFSARSVTINVVPMLVISYIIGSARTKSGEIKIQSTIFCKNCVRYYCHNSSHVHFSPHSKKEFLIFHQVLIL
jgi:hypothetical protein